MSRVLNIGLDELSNINEVSNPVVITSTCAVFAESEVISFLAQKKNKNDIIAGVQASIARRFISMMNRIEVEDEIVFTGDVALNRGLRLQLERELGKKILIPETPQLVGAIGAALIMNDQIKN